GAGTPASPYVGATMCTLPFGTTITSNGHSFYTVQQSDFNLPAATLTDTATLNWNDVCDVGPPPPTGNCTTANPSATAGSASAGVQVPAGTAAPNPHPAAQDRPDGRARTTGPRVAP